MSTKHVLIVDDDKSILRMLEFGLKKLGSNYQIHTATDMSSAINQIENRLFDLVITDFMLPGMTGVDLATAIWSISPDTQVVLMTAYGTNKLRNTTNNLRFDGYLNKPFTIDQVREVVLQVVDQSLEPADLVQEPTFEVITSDDDAYGIEHEVVETSAIHEQLQRLQLNAGVRAVFLISIDGKPVKVVGQMNRAKIGPICQQMATNYRDQIELSTLLDNPKVFKASFHEGENYNLYLCDVNARFLLAVVFDVKLRPGVVWFYTKQTATALSPLLKKG